MGRLGLEVWVRTSFQSFALVDRGKCDVPGGEGIFGRGELSRRNAWKEMSYTRAALVSCLFTESHDYSLTVSIR